MQRSNCPESDVPVVVLAQTAQTGVVSVTTVSSYGLGQGTLCLLIVWLWGQPKNKMCKEYLYSISTQYVLIAQDI
jgi:hypothetical protein